MHAERRRHRFRLTFVIEVTMIEFLKKHSYGVITTVTVVVVVTFSFQVMRYFISLREQPQKRPPQQIIRAVHTRPVAYGEVHSPLDGDGRVVSTHNVVVSTEVRGTMLDGDIPFKEGQRFNRGDVLIRIFDGNAINALRSRKSGFLQEIAAILPDMKIDFPDRFDTWTAFFRRVDIDADLPPLPDITTDKEKIFLATRNVLTEYYSIKSDEITLDKYTIVAPFDGSFTGVYFEVGTVANPGASLARIIRTDSLELEVPVESADARWITIGDIVRITDASGVGRWSGPVVRKARFVDPATQSLNVYVRIDPDQDNPVYEGQYLSAIFPGAPIDGVMEVHRNAVFNFNEVFVVVNGLLEKRTIDIHRVAGQTLMFSGLPEDLDLVIEPLVNAVEHTPVKILDRP